MRRTLGDRIPVALIVVAVTLVAAGGTAYAAVRYDEATGARILPGVTVSGVNVGDMTPAEAERAVRRDAKVTLTSNLVVEAGSRHWDVTPSELGVRANVASAVQRAVAVDDSMGIFSRVFHRLAGRPVDRALKVGYAYDKQKVDDFVASLVKSVSSPATNAGVLLSDGKVRFQHSSPGTTLALASAVDSIRSALHGRDHDVKLPLERVRPKVTDSSLGYTIVVDRSVNRLTLYKGFKVVRAFPVATAAPGYETPPGSWTVVNKAENPTWVNPAPNGWGAGEPASIPPGPGNPLGTRALYLDAPGIRIHGTYDTASVGTYASHGCIRMTIADSEALFQIVPVGTHVIIL